MAMGSWELCFIRNSLIKVKVQFLHIQIILVQSIQIQKLQYTLTQHKSILMQNIKIGHINFKYFKLFPTLDCLIFLWTGWNHNLSVQLDWLHKKLVIIKKVPLSAGMLSSSSSISSSDSEASPDMDTALIFNGSTPGASLVALLKIQRSTK